MRQKYNNESASSGPESKESKASEQAEEMDETESVESGATVEDEPNVFAKSPFCMYKGHTSDLLDISWSKVSSTGIKLWPQSIYINHRELVLL